MTLTFLLVGAGAVVLALFLLRSRSESLDIDASRATEQDVKTLLAAGRKIEAIKAYRYLHRVDLKSAKEAVERLAAELPPPPLR